MNIHEIDTLHWHAMNYRGAQVGYAQEFFEALEGFHNRKIEEARLAGYEQGKEDWIDVRGPPCS